MVHCKDFTESFDRFRRRPSARVVAAGKSDHHHLGRCPGMAAGMVAGSDTERLAQKAFSPLGNRSRLSGLVQMGRPTGDSKAETGAAGKDQSSCSEVFPSTPSAEVRRAGLRARALSADVG